MPPLPGRPGPRVRAGSGASAAEAAVRPRAVRWQRHLAGWPARALLWAACAAPAAWLVAAAATDGLGANPAEALIRGTGDWTLRFLCLTLAVTPLRQLSGWHELARWRRTLGLTSFAYGVLHFLGYAVLDMGGTWQAIVADIPRRPFILVGSLALLLMVPLAATSTAWATRMLGGARWRALHRAVHATAALALLHFFWMRSAKNDWAEVAVYAAVLGALWAWRLRRAWPPGEGAPAAR